MKGRALATGLVVVPASAPGQTAKPPGPTDFLTVHGSRGKATAARP